LDRKCRRNLADEFFLRRERAGELRRGTSRTGAH
jgi:hypothetical protein